MPNSNIFQERREIVDRITTSVTGIERVVHEENVGDFDGNFRLPGRPFAWSVTDEEGAIMHRAILSNDLKHGYEIATAFGYSALYIGSALAANGGRLLSMDCYFEELMLASEYEPEDVQVGVEKLREKIASGVVPEGLEVARRHAESLGLQDTVTFKVGLSPNDVPVVAEPGIDFVFVDSGHHGVQPTQDVLAVFPYLAPKCAIFFHDGNQPAVEWAVHYTETLLHSTSAVLNTRNRLTMVGRGLSRQTYRDIQRLVARPHRRKPIMPRIRIAAGHVKRKLTGEPIL